MEIEKLVEWAEKIPMEGLYDIIRNVTGLENLEFTSKVMVTSWNDVIIKFESQDISDKINCFIKLMFKEIFITSFNSKVSKNFCYWGTVAFSYRHPSGGSNAYTFLTVFYDDKNGWTYKED